MAWPLPSDYQEAIQNPGSAFADPDLLACHPEADRNGLPRVMSGSFAAVFPMVGSSRKWAARCFTVCRNDQEERYKAISEYLRDRPLPFLVPFQYLSRGIKVHGQWYPLLKMEWVSGEPLTSYVAAHLGDAAALGSLAAEFAQVVGQLAQQGIAHGDLQHGNILVCGGRLRLVDYDGVCTPQLVGKQAAESGHRNYQHPLRCENLYLRPDIDRFSTWVIYISLIVASRRPELWTLADGGDDCLLFRKKDFEYPASSSVITLMEDSGDSQIQALARQLRSFLYASNLAQIPQLTVATSEAQLAGSSARTPAWIDANTPKLVPAPVVPSSASAQTGAAWVLDHTLPVASKVFNPPFRRERSVLLAFAILLAATTALVLAAGLLPGVATVLDIIGLLTVGLCWGSSYHRRAEVRDKRSKSVLLGGLEKEISAHKRELKRLEQQLQSLERERAGELSRVQASHAQSLKDIKTNHQAIDVEYQRKHGKTASELAGLHRAEQTELATTLGQLRAVALRERLSSCYITSANIPGIGTELTHRLVGAGVYTAADIEGVRIANQWNAGYQHSVALLAIRNQGERQVDRVGPQRARSLLQWRQSLEAEISPSLPNSLSRDAQALIRQKYAAQQAALERQAQEEMTQRSKAHADLAAKESQVSSQLAEAVQQLNRRYMQRLEQLKATLRAAHDHLAEDEWMSKRTRHELIAYQKLTLGAYVGRILSMR